MHFLLLLEGSSRGEATKISYKHLVEINTSYIHSMPLMFLHGWKRKTKRVNLTSFNMLLKRLAFKKLDTVSPKWPS
jgi:hypothetical protein